MRIRILPYRSGSRSARALADALGGRVLRLQGSTFRQRPDDVVINWGSTNIPPGIAPTFNADVQIGSNKRSFFLQQMNHDNEDIIPRFWTGQPSIPDDAFPIVCRTLLAGHSGAGIVIAHSRDELVAAPLYTQYVKKKAEYRIHLGRNRDEVVTIAEQRKVRRQDHDNPNFQIRNHQNGFVYQRNDIVVPEAVREAARRAFIASGLDFGGVDVIFNEQQQRAYVLEINSACGLEGSTVEDYADFFRGLINA